MKEKTRNILIVAAVVVVLLIPGLLGSIGALIFGSVSNCDDTPYSENCFCEEEEERLTVQAFGLTKFICEIEEKFIDPNDSDWEIQTISFGNQLLAETYPTCNSIGCSQGTLSVDWGWKDFERRAISMECLTSSVPQQRLNNITFFLDDGTVFNSSCGDFVEPDAVEPETEITFVGTGPGIDTFELRIKTECKGVGTVDESYTHILPEGKMAFDWWFRSTGTNTLVTPVTPGFEFYTCNLVNEQQDSVTVNCVAECSGTGGISAPIKVSFDSTPNICQIEDKGFDVGDIQCCTSMDNIQCNSDGSWETYAANPVCNGIVAAIDCNEVGH